MISSKGFYIMNMFDFTTRKNSLEGRVIGMSHVGRSIAILLVASIICASNIVVLTNMKSPESSIDDSEFRFDDEESLGEEELTKSDAGPSQSVDEGVAVYLDGSASFLGESIQFGPELLVNDDIKTGDGKFNSHPSVAAGPDGVAHIVWRDARNTDMWEIFYANTADGLTISKNVEVTDNDPISGTQGQVDVAIDSLGRIHVAWGDMRDWPEARAIYYSRSDDGGLTFSKNIRVDEWLGVGVSDPDIAFGPNNDLYIAFENSGSSIYYVKSTDGGDSFGPTILVSNNGDHPYIVVDTNSTIHMVWRAVENRNGVSRCIAVYSESDDGLNFTDPVRVNNGTETNYESAGGIEIDQWGNIHVLYHAGLDDPDDGVRVGVYYTISKDGGIHFSERVRVSDEGGPSVPYGRFALDPFGNPHVAWHDRRTGTSDMNVYYDFSTDNGLSFGKDMLVATTQVGEQYGPDIAVDYRGFPHIVWGDNRIDGDVDTYYRGGFRPNAIVAYEWDFDNQVDNDEDGIYDNDRDATGPSVNHTYGDNGVFTATLTVLWENGTSSKDTCNITVTNTDPSVTPPADLVASLGESVLLTASGTDQGTDDLIFIWNWGDSIANTKTTYYNDGMNPDSYPSPNGTYPFSATDTVTHVYDDSGVFTVTLIVRDDDGGETSYQIIVTINKPYVDNTPPTITNLQPPENSTTNDTTPTISGDYEDTSGINVSGIMLKVDGINVTSSATITASRVTYAPGTALADGNHTVYLEVKDTNGNLATATWNFTVETSSSDIPPPTPTDFLTDYWWILLVLAVVIIIFVVFLFLFWKRRKKG
jgi:hypothetical protein